MYESIVFLDHADAEPYLNMLRYKGPEAVIHEMKNWHYPGEHETKAEFKFTDSVYQTEDRYILVWSDLYEYVGLLYKLPEAEGQTEEILPCNHEPDWLSISIPQELATDHIMEGLVDINCKHCGKSGSIRLFAKNVQWD